jgi:hypothetical protein
MIGRVLAAVPPGLTDRVDADVVVLRFMSTTVLDRAAEVKYGSPSD